MVASENVRQINELLSQLGDLLDPYRRAEVTRAYTLAQNSLCSADAAPAAFSELAAKLRAAADMAERVAEISR